MPKQCQDAYFVQFNLFPEMLSYHEDLRRRSRWVHTSVKSLEVAPLDKTAPLFSDHTGFDAEVTEDAIADTADHLGLAVKVDERFPGNVFTAGYSDHAITSASWSLPGQKRELLDTYSKLLTAQGHARTADKLTPGIRFSTSDTGMASAKVSALLLGLQYPIHIGGMVAVDHRRQAKVSDFADSLDMLFAQFDDSIARLSGLLKVYLDHPVNAMTAVCKRLSLPKKAALEAIDMFEAAMGEAPATAHDVFMAMQEIPFILKTGGKTPEAKLLALQESMARALTLRWTDYDFAKKVSW